MKNKYILSSVLGGSFFAISYLLLSLGIVPSLVASTVAFSASTLIFNDNYKLENLGKENEKKYHKLLLTSERNLIKLKQLKINDSTLNNNIKNIVKLSNNIINLLKEKPEKIPLATKFLNYYLPITVIILEKFDEIDDNVTSVSSKNTKEKIKNLIINIETAFENQLNNLYNDEMIDINAEIKVFETMLKADGLVENGLSKKKDGDEYE